MFRPVLNEKIGNTLVYLAERINPLYLTKALKLLYLLDETSVKETGVPVTWLEYKVWKLGPVAEEIHNELRHNKIEKYGEKELTVKTFIGTLIHQNPVENKYDSFEIYPLEQFNKGEFSEYEIELLDKIIDKYGKLSSKQLVEVLHKEGTLWDQLVKESYLKKLFENISKSDTTIPFYSLIQSDKQKQMVYTASYEALSFQEEIMFADVYQ